MKTQFSIFFAFFYFFLSVQIVTAQDECSATGFTIDGKLKPSDATFIPYQTRTICQLPGFYENSANVEVNKYGSRTDKKTTGKGYFRVEKIDGRWWVIDPDGYYNINKGVCFVGKGKGAASLTAFSSLYSSDQSWMNATKDLLFNNGFNCAGAWSYNYIITASPDQNTRPLVYTEILDWMVNYAKSTSRSIGDYIFAFEPGFVAYCESQAQSLENKKTDKNLFGYFSDNELPMFLNTLTKLLAITNVNDANKIAAQNWLTSNGYTTADASKLEVQQKFLAYYGKTYYSVVYNAIKKYDPNHMYLGSKVLYNETRDNPYFMREVGPFHDVFSTDYYGIWSPSIDKMNAWADNAGKPFLVAEFFIKGADADPSLTNVGGSGWLVKTQRERGLWYQSYTLALLESKNCIGWHWFRYMDNDPTRTDVDPSNIDSNKGIVTIKYEPYNDLLDKMQDINLKSYNLIDYFDSQKPVTCIYPEVDANFKGSVNEGTADRIGIKLSSDDTFREAFLRFDLNGKSLKVNRAVFKMVNLKSGELGMSYQAQMVADNAWTETGITREQRPAATDVLGTWNYHSSDVEINVKNSYTNAVANNNKLSIKLSATRTCATQIEYASRENPQIKFRPRIEITENEAANVSYLTDIVINGNVYYGFNPQIFDYNIILPSNTTLAPTLVGVIPNSDMTVTINGPTNLLSNIAADRTATIIVTSADGSSNKTYKIIFNIEGQTSIPSINENKKNGFIISPNPIRKNSTVKLTVLEQSEENNVLTIRDVNGKAICNSILFNSQVEVSFNNILSGLYFFSVANNKETLTKKICVLD